MCVIQPSVSQVLRSTKIKDLIAASGGLHITHAVIFTRTDLGLYMKLCSLPKGPTITFRSVMFISFCLIFYALLVGWALLACWFIQWDLC